MNARTFVVGVSGVPGSGKTTLVRRLAQHFANHEIVYYDQFQTITSMSHHAVRDWFNRGGDPNEFSLSELVAELQRAKSNETPDIKVVLFETPFGRLHRATGAFIDFSIWIDVPLDIALSRATISFLDLAASERDPHAAVAFIKWQQQYMLNYPLLRPMYLAQGEKILTQADFVLDGALAVNEGTTILREAISSRL